MIVMKFGGTSVESPEAITRLKSIVADAIKRRPVVVVSAMGKTTNRLIALADAAISGDSEYICGLQELQGYHKEVAAKLISGTLAKEIAAQIDSHFEELSRLLNGLAILGELTPKSLDTIAAYGERLSSFIVCGALQQAGLESTRIDSRDVIVTDDRYTQASPDFAETYRRLERDVKPVAEAKVAVMGGFIASTLAGATTTLGRGGSDYSAAIIGAGIGAEEIQIWTDVDGMMTTDPRLVSQARRLKSISFAEAAELAYFGAKVLHPSTVRPAMDRSIPVVILNSRNPSVSGTRIVAGSLPCKNIVKAIAFKKGITLLNIHSDRMLMAYGFLRRVFEVFDRFETPVDMVATSEVSVSLTIDDVRFLGQIQESLRSFADVGAEKNCAIVSVVGEGIREHAGVANRVFSALRSINIKMISQGASLLNLGAVVANSDVETAVKLLHDEFFSEIDPEVFE